VVVEAQLGWDLDGFQLQVQLGGGGDGMVGVDRKAGGGFCEV
jgi:hypothetical protein